ncbi:serine/threonine protein kinase psk1 [Bachmanniomyces sp. S44760]|nr:serine/threonine protein kinase psk1 [Bachmanniomyces sp. S44760]
MFSPVPNRPLPLITSTTPCAKDPNESTNIDGLTKDELCERLGDGVNFKPLEDRIGVLLEDGEKPYDSAEKDVAKMLPRARDDPETGMRVINDLRTSRELLSFDNIRVGTPPINIAMTPTASRSRSRQRQEYIESELALLDPTPKPIPQAPRTGRKKKKHHKPAASPSLHTVRGFTPTPVASGDEDSDFSVKSPGLKTGKGDLPSYNSSPSLRPIPSTGGISSLRQQLDTLDLETVPGRPSLIRSKSKRGSGTPSSTSVTSDSLSDGDQTEMTSYEVALEHDFVSSDAPADVKEGFSLENTPDDITRKMTAVDFEPLSCLGKGSFGTVLLVKHSATGRLYAQKHFKKASLTVHKRLVEQTKTERVILESVNRHPFVVKLYYAFQDQEKLYLILEYAQGGELFSHLAAERMFSHETAAFYMAEMVLALEHLHSTVGVVYRDLKPENCLLDSEGHLLLTDFGLSKVAVEGEESCKSILGTIEYMAPEVILGQDYGYSVDWWSFGALGYDLLTGAPPFRANNHAKMQEKILKQKLSLPYYLGPDSKDLLTRLLRKEPNKRLGSCMPKDMLAIKKHRFFRKIDWNLLAKREAEPPIRPLITDPALAENFSNEFTDLAISPVRTHHDAYPWGSGEANPFGGFSFVASRSLLESGDGCL